MGYSVLTDGTLVPVGQEEHKGLGHALLSPSSSSRWLKCMPSINVPTAVDPRADHRTAADEGTAAHMLLEYVYGMVLQGMKPRRVDNIRVAGERNRNQPATEDMKAAVRLTMQAVGKMPTVFLEKRVVPTKTYSKYLFGTADIIAVDPNGPVVVRVVDLKYGRSFVSEDSPQLLLYLMGACRYVMEQKLAPLNNDSVLECVIVQPRAPGESVRRRALTISELNEKAKQVLQHVDSFSTHLRGAETHIPESFRVAGAHCKYCKHTLNCSALEEHAERAAASEFSSLPTDEDRLVKQAELLPTVKLWVAAVEEALKVVLRTRPDGIPSHKLVRGRGQRKWKAGTSAQTLLEAFPERKDLVFTELLSVAKVEKLLPRDCHKDLAEHYTQMYGARLVVPVSDPRPAISPGDEFSDVKDA